MKTFSNKFLILAVFLYNSIALAQPNPDPDVNDPDALDAPLDGGLLWLAIFAVLLAYFCIRSSRCRVNVK